MLAISDSAERNDACMRKLIPTFSVVFLFPASLTAQSKRLWVLRAPGEMVEYDPATFAEKQTVKIPAEAVASPQSFSVNHLGQMLFAAPVILAARRRRSGS